LWTKLAFYLKYKHKHNTVKLKHIQQANDVKCALWASGQPANAAAYATASGGDIDILTV